MMSKANAYKQHDDKRMLVEKHAPLVKRIAHHLIARLPASVLVEDLIQAGMIGLLEASRNFDESKGASFETFAGIRIRGAMLDEIRKGDWTPRSVHKNGRAIADAISEVEREMGGDAKDSDVAARMRDEKMERVSKDLKSKRGAESLMDMHEKKIKKEKKAKEEKEGPAERRPFDRDIDLKANQFDEAMKKRMLKAAAKIDTRFSSGNQKFL